MPITKLNTYESVPIGKNNFDEYLFYVRELTSRANPFVGASADDDNKIIPIGSGVSLEANGSGITSSSDVPYFLPTFYWEPTSKYLIEYIVNNVEFNNTSTTTSNMIVYFGDASLLGSSDVESLGYTQIDVTELNSGTNATEALVFSPSASDDSSIIFYIPEEDFGDITANISVKVYELSDNSLITLTGQSSGSYVFIVNDSNELFALPTSFLTSDYATPGVSTWQLPLSFISRVSFSPGQINYVYKSETLPFSFNKIDPSDYIDAKTDFNQGSYERGFILHTLNGVPQISENSYSPELFYSVDLLSSDEILELKSIRLGAEYPTPVYSNSNNHQYADEVIWGFSGINASFISSDALGGIEYQNKLRFPYTDFTLDAALLLIHKKVSGLETYYYIPRDSINSPVDPVKENHYRVIDPSSGLVEFNFNLNLTTSAGDRFLIVSVEQLSQVITNNVTEYFSSYGKLYSPTSNTSFSTKILSFDSSLLLAESFETTLPELGVIPSTKILGSGGGPILADSENEFDALTLYAFSYPGRVDADEFVRLQVNSYEPDIIDIYYYCGTSAANFVKTDFPYPVYIKILDNKISWYNRGINFLTYDLVNRADFTSLCLAAKTNIKPNDSTKLSETRRRSSFTSSVASVITPLQTTFVGNPFSANSFLVNNGSTQITSVSASPGSILVGRGTLPPTERTVGNANDVLSVRLGTPTWASDIIVSEINGITITSGTNEFTISREDTSLIRTGGHSLTLTTTGNSNVTFPTSGTLATTAQLPTVNNATLTMNVSGTGLSGSQTFTANQASNATFTVTSNATSDNTANTIVSRDASGNFNAGTITATLSGNATNVTGTVAITNGGTGATTNTAARTNLGATTIGSNLFTLTNPNAITFPRFNAENTVSSLTGSDFRNAIDAAPTSHSHTITWSGGDVVGPTLSVQNGTAVAIPSASGSASGVITTTDQTFAGFKTFRTTGGTRFEQASNQAAVLIKGGSVGTGNFSVTVEPTTLSANRTLTLADGNTTLVAGTMVSTSGNQSIAGTKTFTGTLIIPTK
jgi:hypothetical protein